MGDYARSFRTMPLDDKVAFLRKRARNGASKVRRAVWWELADRLYLQRGKPLPRLLRDVRSVNFRALNLYQTKPYPGRITMFRAGERHTFDRRLLWSELAAGGIEVHDVGGPNLGHLEMIKGPEVEIFAGELSRSLDAAIAAHAPGSVAPTG
jgi:hypothetical protein